MGKDRKALVVDDTFLVRHALRKILEGFSFQVDESPNGLEGLRLLKEKGVDYYDLLFADVRMPIMGGMEFLKTARGLYGDRLPPLLVCTSERDQDTVRALVSLKISGYVLKPINKVALEKKILELFPVEGSDASAAAGGSEDP